MALTQGSSPAYPIAGQGTGAPYNPLSQYLSYITNPSAYGSIPNIPATTVNTNLTSPQTQLSGYPALNQQAATLAGQQMGGQLDPSVIANMATAGAERGVAMGSPGSANANAAYLRALGLDTQQLEQQGMGNYLNLLQTTPRDTTTTQTNSNNVLQSLYAAAPDPMSAALANLGAQGLGLQAGNAAGSPAGGGGLTVGGARPTGAASPFGSSIGPAQVSGPAGGGGYGNPYSQAIQTAMSGNTYGAGPATGFDDMGDGSFYNSMTGEYMDSQGNIFTGNDIYGGSPAAGSDMSLYDPNTGSPYDWSGG